VPNTVLLNGGWVGLVLQVLRFEYEENRDVLGAAVLGLDDIYLKLRQFHGGLRKSGHATLPSLYLVAADVQSCFDTIKQDKLCDIIAPVVGPDYVVQKFSTVQAAPNHRGMKRAGPFEGSVGLKPSSLAAPRVQFCKKACRPEHQAPFPDVAAAAASERRKPVIFCDGVVYPSVDRSKCLQLLRQHICEHVVMIRGQPYLQGTGIPQGSVVSTALCNYYYGKLETETEGLSRYAAAAHSLLMRLTDDYLFVTTDRHLASEFAGTLHRGFAEYNCRVNPAKTVVNFELLAVNATGETVAVPQTHSGFVPWCGLLLDAKSLDVYANYSRCYRSPCDFSRLIPTVPSVP
jgi:telomerase reverse transcriptase